MSLHLDQSKCACEELPGIEVFSTYNLITLNNYSTDSEVENRTIVCGSFVSSASSNYGIRVASSVSARIPVLEINEDIVAGTAIQVNHGSLAVSSRLSRNVTNSSDSVKYKVDGRDFNINDGAQGATAFIDKELSARCLNITASIPELSKLLTRLPTTPGLTYQSPSDQPAPFIFNVWATDCRGRAVFNFPADKVWNDKVQSIKFTSSVENVSLVVINLSGATVTLGSGTNIEDNSFFNTDGAGIVIWNLWEATTVHLRTGLKGALLAPKATVDTKSSIDGAVAVDTMITNGELHIPYIKIPKCL